MSLQRYSLSEQCADGAKKYGSITKPDDTQTNFKMKCLPEPPVNGKIAAYYDFLEERRRLTTVKTKQWFEAL